MWPETPVLNEGVVRRSSEPPASAGGDMQIFRILELRWDPVGSVERETVLKYQDLLMY